MKKPSAIQDGAYTVFFMVGVTGMFISVVALLHLWTREAVARNQFLFLKAAVMEAAGLAVPGDAAAVERWFDSCVREEGSGEGKSFAVLDAPGGRVAARVRVRRGPGLWGEIAAAVGVDERTGALTGVTFTDQNETPGLGARIAEPWFKEQFKGKRGPFRLVPEGTRSASPEEMDAVTGATITSTAVRGILNRVVKERSER